MSKRTAQQLLEQIQQRGGSLEVQLFKEWLTLQLEDAKNNLITSTPDMFATVQGEARALHRLIRQLERPSLTQTTPREIAL